MVFDELARRAISFVLAAEKPSETKTSVATSRSSVKRSSSSLARMRRGFRLWFVVFTKIGSAAKVSLSILTFTSFVTSSVSRTSD